MCGVVVWCRVFVLCAVLCGVCVWVLVHVLTGDVDQMIYQIVSTMCVDQLC